MGTKITFEMLDAEFTRRLREAMDKGVREVVIIVEGDAAARCPVDTGRLRASITHDVKRDGDRVIGRIGTGVAYAPYVEYGTVRQAPQPYLRPAAIENQAIAGYVLEKHCAKVIK